MPISVLFLANLDTPRLRRAEHNLRLLLQTLNPSYQVILHDLNTKFVFDVIAGESGASDYRSRTIELNAIEFSRFTYKSAFKPSHNQRWAHATLKEETIHYLASHCQFDNSTRWIEASKIELRSVNSLRKKLRKKQRRYDSSDDEIKLSPKNYRATQSLWSKIQNFVLGESEDAEELLVDVLLIRDYLRARSRPPLEVENIMKKAFPNTYALALEFEADLDARSRSIDCDTCTE